MLQVDARCRQAFAAVCKVDFKDFVPGIKELWARFLQAKVFHKKQIAVVDDTEASVAVLLAQLKKRGASVVRYKDGEAFCAAVELGEHTAWDAVVLVTFATCRYAPII